MRLRRAASARCSRVTAARKLVALALVLGVAARQACCRRRARAIDR